MSLRFALLSLFILLPLGAVSQAKYVAGISHTEAENTTNSNPGVAPRKARTPADRLLKPYLDAHIAGNASKPSMQTAPVQPDISAAVYQPNFGGYLSAPFYPARLESSCVAYIFNCGVQVELAADFNQDGKTDIAVIQYDGTLNILLNSGAGVLAAPVSYLNPNYSSSYIQQGFAADVNNDGYPDIVEYDSNNHAVIVYLNQKNGTFGAALTVPLSAGAGYGFINSIAIGDVNGDGFPDIVTVATNSTSQTTTNVTVQSYLGNGSGGFKAPGTTLTQTVTIPAFVQLPGSLGIILGDLNNDSKLDLALDLEEQTSQTTGSVVATVAMGNGDGTFGPLNVNNPVSVPVTAPPNFPFLVFGTSGVQIANLSKSPYGDVAIDANNSLYVVLGTGSGDFSAPVQTANVDASTQILYADVNGDGIPDMIQFDGVLNVWTGNGDGTFTQSVPGSMYILDGGGPESIAVASFTGSGNEDIAQLGATYKQVSLFFGNGKGAFQGAPALSSTTDPTPGPALLELEAAADIVGNGSTDPLFVDDNGAAPYLVSGLSNGSGGFTYVTALPASAVPNIGFIEPVHADFNGDGKEDLLFAGTDDSLSVALSNGDGTFKTPVALALPALDCSLSYAATGDLNGDGNVDIVVAYSGDAACGGTGSEPSGYFVALGKGDGTFATPAFTASGNELYSAALADMNQDGNLDLILDDAPFDGSGDFAIDLLPGNGDGTFSTGTAIFSNSLVSQVVVGDYNQDGKPDLILFSEGNVNAWENGSLQTAGIDLLPGNGDGTFGDSSQLGTGNFFLNGALVDINNDGIPDLVAALYGTPGQPNTYYGLSTLLGTGGGSFAQPVNSLESLNASLPIAGNFLGNNAPGILVSTPYGTALFLGQGGTKFSLALSAASVTFGQTDTLTATLTPSLSGRPTPTGTVAFYDGTTLLGSVPVSSSSAVYSASALAVGSHSITAVYSGDGNFNPNTSAATAVTVSTLAPGFTLTATPATVTVPVGQQGVATVTLTANATFSGSISLTCSGLPANSSCVINPSQVTLTSSSSATATVILGTTTSAANYPPALSPVSKLAGGLSLAGLVCCFGLRRFNRRAFSTLALLFLVLSVAGLSGCSNGNGVNTLSKGTYAATITATPGGSTATSQTTTLSVTVQ